MVIESYCIYTCTSLIFRVGLLACLLTYLLTYLFPYIVLNTYFMKIYEADFFFKWL